MKTTNTLKALAAGMLLSFSVASSASTYYDNTTTSFNLSTNGPENYVGTVDAGGKDMWKINLLRDAGLTVDITTSQDTGSIDPQNVSTAVAMLDNISRVELLDSEKNFIGGADAVYSLANFGSLSTLTSFVNFSVNTLLGPGTYYLRILGDEGAAYSGTVSAVPLPGAALLFGTALFGAGALRRKQKASATAEMAAA